MTPARATIAAPAKKVAIPLLFSRASLALSNVPFNASAASISKAPLSESYLGITSKDENPVLGEGSIWTQVLVV